MIWALSGVAVGLVLLAIMVWQAQRQAKVLSQLKDVLENYSDGVFDTTLDVAQVPKDLQTTLQRVREEWLSHKEIEQRSLAEYARVEAAVEQMKFPVLIADEQGVVLLENKAAKALFSHFQGGLLGHHLEQNFPLKLESSSAQDELTCKTPKGNIPMSCQPLRLDSRGLVGYVLSLRPSCPTQGVEKALMPILHATSRGDLSQRVQSDTSSTQAQHCVRDFNQMLNVTEQALDETQALLQSLANGSLDARIQGDYHGLFEQVQNHGNRLADKLQEVLEKVRDTTDGVVVASVEISQGNVHLSQRTEQQAAGLEETAASVAEITAAITRNADHARQANVLAQSARHAAESGGAVVSNAVSAMSAINESSKKIAEIITVIDEIAAQTNLLALNASVEAARAGEQGRGFAVVAGEVGNLAGRSATAAKEIKSLIEDSVRRVSEGSQLVNESGGKLKDIVSSVQSVSEIVQEISESSESQSNGIREINKAMSQMDETTQQNAALVEQVAVASESLKDQSAALNQQLSFFDLASNARQSNSIELSVTDPASQPTDTSTYRTAVKTAKPDLPHNARTSIPKDDNWDEF